MMDFYNLSSVLGLCVALTLALEVVSWYLGPRTPEWKEASAKLKACLAECAALEQATEEPEVEAEAEAEAEENEAEKIDGEETTASDTQAATETSVTSRAMSAEKKGGKKEEAVKKGSVASAKSLRKLALAKERVLEAAQAFSKLSQKAQLFSTAGSALSLPLIFRLFRNVVVAELPFVPSWPFTILTYQGVAEPQPRDISAVCVYFLLQAILKPYATLTISTLLKIEREEWDTPSGLAKIITKHAVVE